jgi:hypothetical protein
MNRRKSIDKKTTDKMRHIYNIALFVVVTTVLFSTVNYIFDKKLKYNVIIMCRYIRYACGDCYPRYRVDKVFSGIKDSTLLGKDIYIKYLDTAHEKVINNTYMKCASCFNFYYKGDIKYSVFNGFFTLTVDSVSIIPEFDSCCNDTGIHYYEDYP